MQLDRLLIISAIAGTLTGCGYAAQGTPEHNASPSSSPSATSSSPSTPSPGATAGWPYTNTAGGYSLQYPASWYQIPNPNTPNDYPSSFSNEKAGYWPRTSPEIGTSGNVFLTVMRDPTKSGCSSPTNVTSSSGTALGVEPAKRYVIASPPGMGSSDTLYRILVDGVHRGHCWSATFDSRTQTARDGSAATDDQIIASFKFLD